MRRRTPSSRSWRRPCAGLGDRRLQRGRGGRASGRDPRSGGSGGTTTSVPRLDIDPRSYYEDYRSPEGEEAAARARAPRPPRCPRAAVGLGPGDGRRLGLGGDGAATGRRRRRGGRRRVRGGARHHRRQHVRRPGRQPVRRPGRRPPVDLRARRRHRFVHRGPHVPRPGPAAAARVDPHRGVGQRSATATPARRRGRGRRRRPGRVGRGGAGPVAEDDTQLVRVGIKAREVAGRTAPTPTSRWSSTPRARWTSGSGWASSARRSRCWPSSCATPTPWPS